VEHGSRWTFKKNAISKFQKIDIFWYVPIILILTHANFQENIIVYGLQENDKCPKN
jgi:hypothetical protein